MGMAIAQAEENKNLGARVMEWPAQVKSYVQELQLEMKRVTWPPWKQVRATTVVVIVSVFAFAAYFMVVDYLCNQTVTKLFNTMTK
jgi:preprotein translocase subunit SecE